MIYLFITELEQKHKIMHCTDEIYSHIQCEFVVAFSNGNEKEPAKDLENILRKIDAIESNRIHERNRIRTQEECRNREKPDTNRKYVVCIYSTTEWYMLFNIICKNVKDKVRRTMNSMEYINR